MAQMRVVKTTEDFQGVAHEKGYYRKHYFCPKCGLEVGHESFDPNYMFGSGSILTNGKMPKYCPECGTTLEKEG